MADPKQTAHTPLEITRYVNYDARKRWEIELGEWQEDSSVHVSREKRDAFWFLLELKSAEEIVGKLKNSHDKLVEALEAIHKLSQQYFLSSRAAEKSQWVDKIRVKAEAALRAAKEE